MWHKEADTENELITWYNDYKQQKSPKAKVKEEVMSISWNFTKPRYWFISENEEIKKKLCKIDSGLHAASWVGESVLTI